MPCRYFVGTFDGIWTHRQTRYRQKIPTPLSALVDPKRKNGTQISEQTAWRMLKKHFPKSHEAHAIGDPNEESPG